VALVRTDVSKERSASIIRATRICELGTLAVTSNRRTLRRNTKSCHSDDGGAKFLRKRRFLQEPHGVTSEKAPFFTVKTVRFLNKQGISWPTDRLSGAQGYVQCVKSANHRTRGDRPSEQQKQPHEDREETADTSKRTSQGTADVRKVFFPALAIISVRG
jgi:hypothetical protein